MVYLYLFLEAWLPLAWIASAVFAGHLGDEKNRCGLCWLVWGLLFGPIALIAAAGLPAKAFNKKEHAWCPQCFEPVKKKATKCGHCHAELEAGTL